MSTTALAAPSGGRTIVSRLATQILAAVVIADERCRYQLREPIAYVAELHAARVELTVAGR